MKTKTEKHPMVARRARMILAIREGSDTVSSLARALGVSEATAARDVRALKEQGLLSEKAPPVKGDGRCKPLAVNGNVLCLWIDLGAEVCSAMATDPSGRELFRVSSLYDRAMEPWDNLERIKGQMLALAEEKRIHPSVFRVAVRMPASLRTVDFPEGRFDLAVYEDAPAEGWTDPIKILETY